ncbi:glutamate--cysteine ligase [Streptomyces sp. NRRL WC-3618]|uniref:glutamate-cysteine ligase family protein n=1 Tax=Streptomyces sp. NRRL WC-3618 TaxID=1519490 RepID=UPI0006AE4D1D|nr:glutamate-cysteine ligase family protein [Streptomyces sp. NRRL WC-3618]KOV68524.1 glutamate--cysteine ligase [Streptomyces sp. NRRL WC-3618]
MSVAAEASSLSPTELRSVFEKSTSRELVGIEVESAALDPRTGLGIPYDGAAGIGAYLAHMVSVTGGEPLHDCGFLVGVRLPDGGLISLEHGGAVEYSSPPVACVADLMDLTRRTLAQFAENADRFGFALVPGSQYPFTTFEEVRWMPHSRTSIMREHFESLGNEGMFGPRIMSMILSTQVSFDFTSPVDLAEKLRVQAAASTPAAALFVNAPMDGGEPCGALSRRMQFWSRADPARTRVIPVTLREDFTIDRFIEWALTLPMVHRGLPDGSRQRVTPVPFATLLEKGFDDGTKPDLQDWRDHLSQIFPDVRLRDTLELRAVDGPPYPALGAVPAFWSGLTYDAAARASVWELLRGISPEQHLQGLDDIAVRGMDAQLAGRPMRDLAAELLRLSESGLRAQIAAGREREEAAAYLEPLKEVVRTGETFADRVLALWHSKPEHFPEAYVDTYRIR